jgi:hypothetical protein
MSGVFHNRYLVSVALTFFLLATILITTSYLIDPFRLYERSDIAYENAEFDLFWYLRLHKPYRMEAVRADALVLGSSRAARLAPQFLPGGSQGVGYNASIPGATLYEIMRLMEHGQSIRPLNTVVLGLDYSMFRASQKKFVRGYVDARLRKSPGDRSDSMAHTRQYALDLWSALFSRSALAADINVIMHLQQSQRSYHKDGTWSSNFASDHKPSMYAMVAKHKSEEFSKDSGGLDFAMLEKIIDFCNLHEIKLILIFSPAHAHHMSVIQEAGAWSGYLSYQRSIIDIVQEHMQSGADVQIYGLEHQRRFVHEALDAQEDWFRDGIHYSRDTGNNIMRCLFPDQKRDCDKRRSPLKLTPKNSAQYLSAVNSNKNTYAQAQPEWFAKLQAQLQSRRERQ